MKRYCLAVDLVDDSTLIAEYEQWHIREKAWPEIIKSIIDSGIIDMQIYRVANRLFMNVKLLWMLIILKYKNGNN